MLDINIINYAAKIISSKTPYCPFDGTISKLTITYTELVNNNVIELLNLVSLLQKSSLSKTKIRIKIDGINITVKNL